jgi:hypothetical protein
LLRTDMNNRSLLSAARWCFSPRGEKHAGLERRPRSDPDPSHRRTGMVRLAFYCCLTGHGNRWFEKFD